MHKGPITCVLADQNGQWVFTSGYDKRVYAWNQLTGESVLIDTHAHLVNSLALSQNGRWLASASADYKVYLYDLHNSFKLHRIYIGHADDVDALSFAANDSLLVTTSHDSRVLVWNVETGAIELEFQGHRKDVLSIWVDDERAFTTGDDGKALIWNIRTGELLGEIEQVDCDMDAVSGNTQLGVFAVGADDGQVRIFNSQTLQLQHTFQAHDFGIKRVCFSPTGRYLLTAGYDHAIRIWSTQDATLVTELESYIYQWERWLDWSADESRILGASFGIRYCEWDLKTGKLISSQLELATPSINDLAVSKSLDVATASDDGRFRMNGHQVGLADGTLTNAVGISDDGRYVLWGDHAGCVHLLDRQHVSIRSAALHTGPINSIDFCVASGYFYAGTYGGHVHVFDPESAAELNSWRSHVGAVKAVKVDDLRVITCSSDGSIHIFDRADISKKRVIVGPTGIVNEVEIDSLRNRIASVSRDKVVRVYDLETGSILAQHKVHRYSIKSLAVTDSGLVVSGDYWGHVVVWNPDENTLTAATRIATNGISALRNAGDTVYGCSYDGGIYRVLADGTAEEILRLFAQHETYTPSNNTEVLV